MPSRLRQLRRGGQTVHGYVEPTCMLCGAERPPGHAVVTDRTGHRQGSVCAKHTLAELVLDTQERFMVDVVVTDEGVRAMRRAYARRLTEGESDG